MVRGAPTRKITLKVNVTLTLVLTLTLEITLVLTLTLDITLVIKIFFSDVFCSHAVTLDMYIGLYNTNINWFSIRPGTCKSW